MVRVPIYIIREIASPSDEVEYILRIIHKSLIMNAILLLHTLHLTKSRNRLIISRLGGRMASEALLPPFLFAHFARKMSRMSRKNSDYFTLFGNSILHLFYTRFYTYNFLILWQFFPYACARNAKTASIPSIFVCQ